MLIKVRPDTQWGLGEIRVRFTVEAGIPTALIPVYAVPTIKKAVEQFERLGDGKGHHWKFRDDIPLRFEYSHIQADPYKLHIADVAQDFDSRLAQGFTDCVAILTFERTLDVVEQDPDEATSQDGFADLPAEYIKRLEEAKAEGIV